MHPIRYEVLRHSDEIRDFIPRPTAAVNDKALFDTREDAGKFIIKRAREDVYSVKDRLRRAEARLKRAIAKFGGEA